MAKRTKDRDSSQVANYEGIFRMIDWSDRLTKKGIIGLLDEAQGSIYSVDQGYHSVLYNRLALVAAIADYLHNDEGAWKRFCAHPAWEKVKRKRPKPDNLVDELRSVMRFCVGFTTAQSKTASRYYNAIAPLLDEGVTPEALPAEIERRNGIVALIELHRSNDEPDGDEIAEEQVRNRKEKPRTTQRSRAAKKRALLAETSYEVGEEANDEENLESDEHGGVPPDNNDNEEGSGDDPCVTIVLHLGKRLSRFVQLEPGDKARLTVNFTSAGELPEFTLVGLRTF